jgi:hypothetical protein
MRFLFKMTQQFATTLSERNVVIIATWVVVTGAFQNVGYAASGISSGVVNLYN